MKPDDREPHFWEDMAHPMTEARPAKRELADSLRELNAQMEKDHKLRQRVTVAAWIVVIAMVLATIWFVAQPLARS